MPDQPPRHGSSLLKGLKRDLPDLGRVRSIDEAERALLPGGGEVADPPAPDPPPVGLPDRLPDIPQRSFLLKKKKRITTTFTLRMDIDLHRRLHDIADYNELDMTAIIIEGLEFHLRNFPAPPPDWKRRK